MGKRGGDGGVAKERKMGRWAATREVREEAATGSGGTAVREGLRRKKGCRHKWHRGRKRRRV